MSIDHTQTRKTANLAGIAIDQQQIENLTTELTDILNLVEQVQSLNTDHTEPLYHPLEIKQVMRSDQVIETDQHQRLQSLASQVEADLYLVPEVIKTD